MGDIADMILDGLLCQICGEYLEGKESGFPTCCKECEKEFEEHMQEFELELELED